MTTTNAKNQRPFVLLPSGRVIDLAEPSSTSWTDEDLAIGLSRTYRWGGHSRWSRPLTVAQHSLTVLAIRLRDEPHLSPTHCLYELLHDAEEGLLGFDCIAPLKAYLGAPFAALCARLTGGRCRALWSPDPDRARVPAPQASRSDRGGERSPLCHELVRPADRGYPPACRGAPEPRPADDPRHRRRLHRVGTMARRLRGRGLA